MSSRPSSSDFENSKFLEAKINLIQISQEELVQFYDTEKFMKEINININKKLPENLFDEIKTQSEQIKDIISILSRNYIKVVFFGRTSNGKSTVINAMLQDVIMPTGVGHTTTCFIQLQGSEDETPYLTIGDSNEKLEINELKKLAHNLCVEKLNKPEILNIFYPKNMYNLLKNEVVIIDTPGINMDDTFDDLIDKYCSDADIFVLVENAVSVLTKCEKEFLENVSNKLSKPNPFILYNKWDICEDDSMEEELVLIREEHKRQATEFMVDNMKLCPLEEIEKRIFFVSARNIFKSRSVPGQDKSDYENYHTEFKNFETVFEKCISENIIQTKFSNHCKKIKDINRELKNHHCCLKNTITEFIEQKEEAKEMLKNDKLLLINNVPKIKSHCIEKINETLLKVEMRLRNDFRNINMYHIMNSFRGAFLPNDIEQYKVNIHSYFIKEINNIKKISDNYVQLEVENIQKTIYEKIGSLILRETETLNLNNFPKAFIDFYNNFNENLDYRFSDPVLNFLDTTKMIQIGIGSGFLFFVPILGLAPAIFHGVMWIVKSALNTEAEQERKLKMQYLQQTAPIFRAKFEEATLQITNNMDTLLNIYLGEQLLKVEKVKQIYETYITECNSVIDNARGYLQVVNKNIWKNGQSEEKLNMFQNKYLK